MAQHGSLSELLVADDRHILAVARLQGPGALKQKIENLLAAKKIIADDRITEHECL